MVHTISDQRIVTTMDKTYINESRTWPFICLTYI